MSYEEDDGTEVSAQMEENILLTDFHKNVTDSIRGFDPVTEGPGIRRFSLDHPDLFSESQGLHAAYGWLEEQKECSTLRLRCRLPLLPRCLQ